MSTPTFVILIVCFASIALADDFKTINGKEYKDATVSRVEADGVVLRTKGGISKVYFTELPKEVQERFHYSVQRPSPRTAEQDANLAAIRRRRQEIMRERQAEAETAAVQQAEKINYEVSLKDIPGARRGDRVLELAFDRDVPEPQVVDKMLRESLEHAVAADGNRDIVAIAFLGD